MGINNFQIGSSPVPLFKSMPKCLANLTNKYINKTMLLCAFILSIWCNIDLHL